jgi:hypothetical protein
MKQTFRRAHWRRADLGVAAVAFFVYACTLSRQYMGDGIQFAVSVESASLLSLLQPNHMLYPLTGLWFFRAWQWLGWQGGALLPLQVLSAAAGAVCVGLMYRLADRLSGNATIGLLISLGFGASYGMWAYSTDAEAVTVPLVWSLLVIGGVLVTPAQHPSRGPVILGLLCALAVITYQTGVLLTAPVVAGYLMPRDSPLAARVRRAAAFLLVSGLCSLSIYLLVAFTVFGVRSWHGLLDWQFHMADLGLWGKWSSRGVAQGGYAFLRTFAGYPDLGPGSRTFSYLAEATLPQRAAFAAYYSVVLGAVVALCWAVIKRWDALKSRRRELAVLVSYGLSYGLFATYWVPGDVQFWVPVSAAWWLVASVVLATPGPPAGVRLNDTGRASTPSIRVAGAGVAILAAANLVTTVAPNREIGRNRAYQITQSIRDRTSPQDLIVTTGGDALFLYVPYFAERQTVSLYHQVLHSKRSKASVFDAVRQRARDTWSGGGRVFLAGAWPGQDVWWDSLEAVGLSRRDLLRLHTVQAWGVEGEEIREIVPWSSRDVLLR